jgi:hypothetical protein
MKAEFLIEHPEPGGGCTGYPPAVIEAVPVPGEHDWLTVIAPPEFRTRHHGIYRYGGGDGWHPAKGPARMLTSEEHRELVK